MFLSDGKEALADTHTHTESCYDGTKHVHQGESSSNDGCYTGTATAVYGSCPGSCSYWTQYYCKDCSSYFAGGSTCGQCGSSNTNCWNNYSCSTCGYSGFSSGHNRIITGYTYALNCGKTEGEYYNGDTLVTDTCCNVVVTELTPNQYTQTLYPGSSVNVEAVAEFLDGHTETVSCSLAGFVDEISKNGISQTATLSYGSKSDTAANNASYTTQISLTKYYYVPCSITSTSTTKGTVDLSGVPFVTATGFENCCIPGESFTATAKPKPGYEFTGWYNTSGNTLVSSSLTYSGTVSTSGINVYADFEAVNLTITFNPDGGMCGTISKKVTYNSQYGTLPVPVKTGYVFDNWALEDGTAVTESSTVSIYTAHTLKAVYHEETYTVTYNYGEWGHLFNSSSSTATYNNTYGSLPSADRTGYTLQWQDETGTVITADSTVSITKNHTLTLVWMANQYTITLNYNGAETGIESTTISVTFDSTIGSLPTPCKRGHDFTGWDYNGTTLNATSKYTYPTDITINAMYQAQSYTVTFNTNGGNSVNNATVCYGDTYGTLPTPNKSGYTFDGWYMESSFSTLITGSSIVSVTNNHTLYAKYTFIPVEEPPVIDSGDEAEKTEKPAESITGNAPSDTGASAKDDVTQSNNDYDFTKDMADMNDFPLVYPEMDNNIEDEEYKELWESLAGQYNTIDELKNKYNDLKDEVLSNMELLNSNTLTSKEKSELEESTYSLLDEMNGILVQLMSSLDEYNLLHSEFISYAANYTEPKDDTNTDEPGTDETKNDTDISTASGTGSKKNNDNSWIFIIVGSIAGIGFVVLLVIYLKRRKYNY